MHAGVNGAISRTCFDDPLRCASREGITEDGLIQACVTTVFGRAMRLRRPFRRCWSEGRVGRDLADVQED